MKKRMSLSHGTALYTFGIALIIGCQHAKIDYSDISIDPKDISIGARTFLQDCSACHDMHQRAIGPSLAGLTREVEATWIRSFIRDSKSMIDAGDERAVRLFEEFGVYMPSYSFHSEQKLDQIISYLHTVEKINRGEMGDTAGVLTNPIKESIAESDLVIDLLPFTQIPASSQEMPLTRIVKMDHIPKSDRLFVADLRGQFYEVVGETTVKVLDLNDVYPNFYHQSGLGSGLGSFAFHPEFLENGLLYFTHSEFPGSSPADFKFDDSIKVALQWTLVEWKVRDPSSSDFSGQERELFRINMPSVAHGMQDINFNPYARPGHSDYGLLFINIGDGGSTLQKHLSLVDNRQAPWGKIYRIDPSGKNSNNSKYGIPGDNPFVGQSDALQETYAWGFRNPHRSTWDRQGRLLVSDIGHHRIEEVNLIVPGNNYGWPYREGTFILDPVNNISNVLPLSEDDSGNYTYPIAQYDHDEGNAISGGYEYIGDAVSQMKGKYFFGDIVRGTLFYINTDEMSLGSQAKVHKWNIAVSGKPTNLIDICGSSRVDLRFGQDSNDELYIMTKADGKIYKMAPRSAL
ncbi:MAG: c-type cytochrome [Saprospiraceae bacterium]|nr:c-type cytochrome [Saprospiraceae bacterium]